LQHWGHITMHADRYVLFPAAVGDAAEYKSFETGLPNRPDMGSLVPFRPIIKKRKGLGGYQAPKLSVPVVTLSSLLRRLPAKVNNKTILWDTLKIDAQGIDHLVVSGAGHLLTHFACVIGEFDTRSYLVGKGFDYKKYLRDLHFSRIGQTLFVNLRFSQMYIRKQAICTVPDLRTRYHFVVERLKEIGKVMRRWEHVHGRPFLLEPPPADAKY